MRNAKKPARHASGFGLLLGLLSLFASLPSNLAASVSLSPPAGAFQGAGPALSYSTYLGGVSVDRVTAIAVDSAGFVYVTGSTTSSNFPTRNAIQPVYRGPDFNEDIFIAKLSPSGDAIIYSTYLGGTGSDFALDIAVDSAGSAYVTGYTSSTNFPVTQGAHKTSSSGGEDLFIVKLSPPGSSLAYSSYLGGTGQDRGNGIAVDQAGNAYVTGKTTSADFPTRQGAFQNALRGVEDGFVAKLNASGDTLIYSTYLGGSGNTDQGLDIAVDALGQAYVAGETTSLDFPVSAQAFQPAFGGGTAFFGDAFITKMNAAGSAPVFSTYFGGSGGEIAHAIAIDDAGSAYITGTVDSTDLPTLNAFQPARAGDCSGIFSNCTDAFAAKLNGSGSGLVYSTYLGGGSTSSVPFQSGDTGYDIKVDSSGSAYVTGVTGSTDFPVFRALQPAKGANGDGFVVRLSASGRELLYSTYLGGDGDETADAIALDPFGSVYVAGVSGSGGFPLLRAVQPSYGGGATDTFIVKIASDRPQITGASLSGKKLVVTGENFQPGALILINGAPQGNTKNDGQNPSAILFSKKAKKSLPSDREVELRVKNPDAAVSDPFPFRR
ncbi:MAG TPA: SBBP repeat-containing protein [Blastocatellia bacterium]|nr:SBBP repeat-containing protein [Blastocatellia bacterium]